VLQLLYVFAWILKVEPEHFLHLSLLWYMSLLRLEDLFGLFPIVVQVFVFLVPPWLIFVSNVIYPEALLVRSEEHTSELQSRFELVCRLLLEKKKEHDERKTDLPRRFQ